jgi:hypothetical protein
MTMLLVAASAAGAAAPAGCGSGNPPAAKPTFTAEQLRDPTQCKACHPSHYSDWSRSMHAYATDDPVFVAMNARGQRETNHALGTFCVRCHAPVAVNDGKTDGTNLSQLAPAEKGVTCFFCHSIDSIGPTHANADVGLASDGVMRGELADAAPNTAHASAYSPYQDHARPESGSMCGSCHDIVTQPGGGHIERTFAEWQASALGKTSNVTCGFSGTCHMATSSATGPVALGGPTNRTFHEHDFAAVDIAFAPAFPLDPDGQKAKVESLLADTLQGALCVNTLGGIRVFLDDVSAGHSWPSGSAQDRRAWAEVVASKAGAPIYQSGVVAPGAVVGADPTDKDLWVLRDVMFDAQGQPVDMFWQAACASGNELQVISSYNPTDPGFFTHQERFYPNTPNPGDSYLQQVPDDVKLTLHLQPIGLDVLNDLVASGDLDPSIVAKMSTAALTVGFRAADGSIVPSLEWTPQAAAGSVYPDSTEGPGVTMSCVSTANFNVVSSTRRASDPPTKCSPPATPDAGP